MKIILDSIDHIYVDSDKKRQIQALAGFNLSVRKGEIISIVGASGSGKTTILNIIAGFIVCTKGRVLLDGKGVTGPGRDRVVIFQDGSVFPWYTVEENVGYGLRWLTDLSREDAKTRVDSLLGAVGLEHRRASHPKNLSGGERKRVEIARAFAIHPEVILADEPFGDIDAITRVQLQKLLLELWEKEKNTIILATHDVEEALILCDRVAILSGRPARIKEIIEVPFPRPRELSIRNYPDFIALREKIEFSIENKTIKQ